MQIESPKAKNKSKLVRAHTTRGAVLKRMNNSVIAEERKAKIENYK